MKGPGAASSGSRCHIEVVLKIGNDRRAQLCSAAFTSGDARELLGTLGPVPGVRATV